MNIRLPEAEFGDAITLAEETFTRWEKRRGFYPNQFNSHFKGKLGEIALEHFLRVSGFEPVPHFRNPKSQGLCDIELPTNAAYKRLEIKTWSREHWADQGRCVTPGQLPKLEKQADCVIWCVVDLDKINSAQQARSLSAIDVELMGWSTIPEVGQSSVVATGWRKIANHQIAEESLHPLEELIRTLRSDFDH